jgi:hypothetical protein
MVGFHFTAPDMSWVLVRLFQAPVLPPTVIGALLGRKVELSRWNTAGEEISAPLASNLLWLGSTARLCEVTKESNSLDLLR